MLRRQGGRREERAKVLPCGRCDDELAGVRQHQHRREDHEQPLPAPNAALRGRHSRAAAA